MVVVWVFFSVQLRRNDKSLALDRFMMNFNTVPCLFAADVTGGGVTTCTRVSGEMVKPSMYNCLTLIKGGCRGGGDGSLGAKSPVSKPFRGGWKERVGVSTPGGCWDAGLGAYMFQTRFSALTAAAEETRDRCGAHAPPRMKHSSRRTKTNHFPNPALIILAAVNY